MENITIRFIINGLVQGVGFRYYTKQLAMNLDIVGWCANRYDGSVEGIAQGTIDNIKQFKELIIVGPQRAIVQSYKFESIETDENFERFFVA